MLRLRTHENKAMSLNNYNNYKIKFWYFEKKNNGKRNTHVVHYILK